MSNTIYTRSFAGMDKRVWYVLIVLILVPLALMAYFLAEKKECVPVKFIPRSVLHDTIFLANDPILFSTLSDPNDFNWDFGDQTGRFYGQSVEHTYKSEGDYIVTIRSAFGCEDYRRITVLKPYEPTDDNIPPFYTDKGIVGDSSAVEGETKSFTCKVESDTCFWFMRGNPEMKKGKTVSFRFLRAGKIEIDLYISNDFRKKYTKTIIVEKKADTIKPWSPRPDTIVERLPPSMTDAEIQKKYMDLLAGVVNNVDYDPNEFFRHLCKGGLTPAATLYKKKRESYPLNVILAKLKGKEIKTKFVGIKTSSRPARIIEVKIHRGNDECVNLVEIVYD